MRRGELAAHRLNSQKNKTVFIQGDVNITINGAARIISPSVRIDGDVTINGEATVNGNLRVSETITATEDILGKGVNLRGHVHGGVMAGSDFTSPAN